MKLSTRSLASASSSRPWLTVGIWVLLIAAAIVCIYLLMADATTTDMTFTNNPGSLRGYKLIDEGFPEKGATSAEEFVIVRSPTLTVDDPAFPEETRAVFGALLGGWNWYLPHWLDWLPELHIEAGEAPGVKSDE